MRNIKGYGDVLNEESQQDSLNSELLSATMYGSPKQAAAVLDRGAEINSADASGRTALHWAAVNANEHMIKMLLHRGADPNLEDRQGSSPLRTLMRNATHRSPDFIDLVRFFIGYGADPFKAFDGPREVLDFFKGDISWMPKPLRSKLQRMHRGKSAFGM